MLLAAGAVAGTGALSLGACILIAMLSAILGDIVWYVLGRRYGSAILSLLCRISLEPDSCVNYTQRVYSKFGPSTLLFAKFVPGLSTVMTPLAGRFRVPFERFMLFDSTGALLWTTSYIFVGWLFRAQLEHLADALFQMGSWLGFFVFAALALYALYRYARRRDLYRELRLSRIAPWELKERIDLGEDLLIYDLRNPIEWVEGIIPGADDDFLPGSHGEIDRDAGEDRCDSLLFLSQRSGQCTCGAAIEARRSLSCASVEWRIPAVARARLSGGARGGCQVRRVSCVSYVLYHA